MNPKYSRPARRTVVGATVAGVGAGLLATEPAQASAPGQVAENSFTVVDRRGRQRFLAATTKPPVLLGGRRYPRSGPDCTYLIFNDETGSEKGGIIAAGNGAMVSLDYANSDAIHLGTQWEGKTGGGYLEIRHMPDPALPPLEAAAATKTGIQLFCHTDEGTSLTLNDRHGRPRIVLQVSPNGTPSLRMLDEHGTAAYQLPPP
jgi:hypothetical protein